LCPAYAVTLYQPPNNRMKSIFTCLAVLLASVAPYAQSLLFNGSNNYVHLGNAASLRLTAFTLEAWIRPAGMGKTTNTGVGGIDAVPIIAKGRGEDDAPASLNMNYMLGLNASYKPVADFEEAAGKNRPLIGKTTLPVNTWTHVAVTYEPQTAVWCLYVNGALDASLDLGSNIYPASGSIQPAAIGAALNAQNLAQGFFNGRIDEVRIWNVARSATAIKETCKAQLTSGTGLVARYGFNERSGSTAPNAVAATGNGTLIKSPIWINGFNNSAPSLAAPRPANGSNVTSTNATLRVTANDTNNDKLQVSFYARRKKTSEKFAIILVPDTQNYTAEPQGLNGGANAFFKSQTAWIAKSRAARNIVYTGHLGDCVQNGDRYEKEWLRADTAMRAIEQPATTGLVQGIPYGICVGNHDQLPFGDPKGSTTFYNKYFGTARFSGRTYYGGHSGSNNDNHYQVVNSGGINLLIICPEYDLTSGFAAAGGTLDWMENIVKAHPGHKVIVLSHYVLKIDGTFTTQGSAIYNRLKQYPGFILMMGGHITQGDGEARRWDTYNGRTIHTIASDYQTRTKGGNGLLRILSFDPVNNNLSVQTYSPYTNTYETDSNSQFNLPVDLSTPENTFTRVQTITNIAPGGAASASYAVQQNGTYEWYATISDGEKTVKSAIWNFTTTYTATSVEIKDQELAMLPETAPASKALLVYPNPTNTATVNFSIAASEQQVQVFIYDYAGALVQSETCVLHNNKGSIAHRLRNGTYTFVVATKRERFANKIIVAR
jgi:hypothetical protein